MVRLVSSLLALNAAAKGVISFRIKTAKGIGSMKTAERRGAVNDAGPQCEGWPLTQGAEFPHGLSMLNMHDEAFKGCNEMNTYLPKSWLSGAAFPDASKASTNNHTSVFKYDMGAAGIVCNKLPSATFHVRVKAARIPRTEERLYECFKEQGASPRMVLGGEPFQQLRYAVSSKGHFANMMNALHSKHEPIHPRTFELTNPGQCKEFFAAAKGRLTKPDMWILKPVDGYGGEGIEVVSDFGRQLQEPYGQCHKETGAKRYIVQRYIKPYLIGGKKFHVRTFLLYKFRNGDITAPDPEQAWHDKRGELLFCSEDYAKASDPELKSYATKCNLHNAKTNPHYGEPGKTQEDLVKFFQPTMQTALKPHKYNLLIKRMDAAMGTLADAITQYTIEKGIASSKWESNWMWLGCDFQVDTNLRPWLLEANTCPGEPDAKPGDTSADPYPAMFRVMLTHFRRHFMGNEAFAEQACSNSANLTDQISNVRLPIAGPVAI